MGNFTHSVDWRLGLSGQRWRKTKVKVVEKRLKKDYFIKSSHTPTHPR